MVAMQARRSRIQELRVRVAIAVMVTFGLALTAVNVWGAKGDDKPDRPAAFAPGDDAGSQQPGRLTTRQS